MGEKIDAFPHSAGWTGQGPCPQLPHRSHGRGTAWGRAMVLDAQVCVCKQRRLYLAGVRKIGRRRPHSGPKSRPGSTSHPVAVRQELRVQPRHRAPCVGFQEGIHVPSADGSKLGDQGHLRGGHGLLQPLVHIHISGYEGRVPRKAQVLRQSQCGAGPDSCGWGLERRPGQR